jgi:putative FmdB family regulatory protein
MPIYEYRCEQGHTFEVMQRMSDDPVQTCETCAAPVARVLHPPAVHFKGSGFYNTDYGTRKRNRESADGHKSEGSSESKSSSSSDSGSSGSSDSKSSSGGSDSKSSSSGSDSKSSSDSKRTASKSSD